MDGSRRRHSFSRVVCIAGAALWAASAAAGEGPVKMFPRSGPRDDKPGLADFALPLPHGWSLDEIDTTEGVFAFAKVPAKGKRCENSVWFDYVPAVTLDYAKRLIDTESLNVTSALRHWHERQYSETHLATHAAILLRSPENDLADRSFYLIPARGGVLVIHARAHGDRALDCVALHRDLADTLVSSLFDPVVQEKAEKLSATRSPPPLKKVEPVPRNLEECFAALKNIWSKTDLEEFRSTPERDLVKYHFGPGMGLRNGWGLWSGSPLAKYFQSMGIFHPDDMSAIILTSFWRHLNGEPLRVDEQVKEFQTYWATARQAEAAEKRRAAEALDQIRRNMLGIRIDERKTPTVRFGWTSGVDPERRRQFRVRSMDPFAGGVLITTRAYRDPVEDRGLFTPCYWLDESLVVRPVHVDDAGEVEAAVVIGSSAYLLSLKHGREILVATDGKKRRKIPPPPGAGPLRLGRSASRLLGVREKTIHEWDGIKWTPVHDGGFALPVGGVPPQRVGDRIYFRDEGRGEDDKRLWWLDLAHPEKIEEFTRHTGLVGPLGPRWEFVYGFAPLPDGTLWIAAGRALSDGRASFGGDSLVRWTPRDDYRIALFHGSPVFEGSLLGWGRTPTDPALVPITGLVRGEDGSVLAIGGTGIYRLTNQSLEPLVHFSGALGPGLGYGNLDPTHVVLLGDGRYVVGGHWGGIYLIDPARRDAVRLDARLGSEVSF